MSKVMIVTGGSRGIGAAIAIKAAKAGFDVAVNYVRAKDRAEETVREIEKHGQRGIAVQADVGNEADVLELFRQTDKELGPVTALVNNAAVDYETSIVESDLDRIRQVFDVNIFSVFVSSREAIKRMSTNSGGSGGAIINIGSISARYGGLPGDVPYAASKGAMDSFTLGLSREVGPEGIRVACVRPGLTRTEIFERSIGIDTALELAEKSTVLGRICEPEEVANLVVWMCGEEASYVTTVIYDISGGR
ncbi:SDR family oxidoreductase [Myxococcota bacterium]|jgi:NAD(P)-dependent dehydrogenase (short-subunit alcohol dehydrogenase family)|nr:SDR family oxidoreductase [Myxococcota bacterium]|tara:strand:+ start:117 stop:863 length:747 start_codon:yes stop_codon:yes gene_type:complete